MAEPYETPPSMQDIYDKDKERYSESDRLIEEGDLKGAAEVHPDKETLRNNLTSQIEESDSTNVTRQVLGYGYEVGAGVAFDAATSWLGWTGPLWLAANYAEGAISNAIGQAIRGDDFSLGEIHASGLLGTIPLSQLRLAKPLTRLFGETGSIQRGIASGAIMGGTDISVTKGIDEQRLPTTSELATGVLTGGVLGGSITGAIKAVPELGNKLLKQIEGNPQFYPITNRLYPASGTVGAMRTPDEPPLRQRMIYSQGGMKGGYYNHYDYVSQGWMSDKTARYTLETYQTKDRRFIPGFFEAEKRRQLPGFLDEYGDYLKTKGVTQDQLDRMLTDRQVNLHHIVPIKAGAALYHDTYHGDEAWTAVTDIFEKHGLFPGIGNPSGIDALSKSNFIMALKEPHDLVHHQFLYEILGIDGSRFFTPERLALIESGLEGRKFVAEEYAIIIKQSKRIIEDAMRQMKAMFSKSGIPPEELAELMSKATDTGELKILNSDLILRSVNEQLKGIADEVNRSAATEPLGKEVPDVIQKELNKYMSAFFNRIQKLYDRGGKGGLGKPPVNPY